MLKSLTRNDAERAPKTLASVIAFRACFPVAGLIGLLKRARRVQPTELYNGNMTARPPANHDRVNGKWIYNKVTALHKMRGVGRGRFSVAGQGW